MSRSIRALLLAAALAGCALVACGGSSDAPVGAQRNYVPSTPGPLANPQNVRVSVTVPAAGTSARHTGDISSGTQSVSIVLAAVNGQTVPPQKISIVNTSAGGSNCSPGVGGLVCTGTVQGAAGVDAFTVTLYSGQNGAGSVLSTGTILSPIDTPTASLAISNSVSLSLLPLVANLQMIVTPASLLPGTKANGTITAQPLDASGALIVGLSGTVSLLISGGDNTVTFGKHQATTANVPLYHTIKFAYDGSTSIQSNVTITGTLTGSSPSISANATLPVNFPPTPSPSPTPTGLVSAIYVLNTGANAGNSATVTVYPVTSNGNAVPIRTLQLSSAKTALSIAVDGGGQLHVGYDDGSVETFAYNATGSAKPSSTLEGSGITSTFISPLAMAIGQGNELVTIGSTNLNNMLGNTGALVFSSSASGNSSPINAWNFINPQISISGECTCSVAGLAMDSAGNFYVDGSLKQTILSSAPGIYVAPATASGPGVNASRTIPGDATTTIPSTPFDGTVAGLALDAAGTIYESQYVGSGATLTGAINVFAAGATGGTTDVAPKTVITGAPLNIVVGQNVPALPIAVFSGDIIAANGSTNSVIMYATSGGSPLQTITGGNTGLNGPSSIAVGLSGPGGP